MNVVLMSFVLMDALLISSVRHVNTLLAWWLKKKTSKHRQSVLHATFPLGSLVICAW